MLRLLKSLITIFYFTLCFGCSSSDSPESIDEQQLVDIETDLVFFTYTQQIGNTPDRLQYEIKFTNSNDVGVVGFYRVTTLATFGTEEIEASRLSTNFSECYEIEANSVCTFSFDETGDINLGSADSIEFVSASYNIDSTF